jgi:hypothetical protein
LSLLSDLFWAFVSFIVHILIQLPVGVYMMHVVAHKTRVVILLYSYLNFVVY